MAVLTWDKLRAMKLLTSDDGNINLFGRLGTFIPAETTLHLHRLLSQRDGRDAADELIYEAGAFQTRSGATKYFLQREQFKTLFMRLDRTGDAALEMGREMLAINGLGSLRALKADASGRHLILAVPNSPFALEQIKTAGRSPLPVCHYLRGVIAGALELYYRRIYSSREISCRADGVSKECVFEFREKGGAPAAVPGAPASKNPAGPGSAPALAGANASGPAPSPSAGLPQAPPRPRARKPKGEK